MSQCWDVTEDGLEILFGFDKPLEHFFATVLTPNTYENEIFAASHGSNGYVWVFIQKYLSEEDKQFFEKEISNIAVGFDPFHGQDKTMATAIKSPAYIRMYSEIKEERG